MEGKYYTSERSIQLLISLLKQHNIKKIIASPGATNLSLVASLQQDSFFEMYSCVDERSAAYIACGLAAESGEPVVLTCTGATASRNYVPGLTEAYYRKLPVLAVTSTQDINKIGHHIPQVIDRRSIQNDIALLSEHIPVTRDDNDEWSNTVKINRALLELRHRGGGPVHINLTTTYSRDYSVKELPVARMIRRTCLGQEFPELPNGRIAVYVGSHAKFTDAETEALDNFCASNDAVVFCDHTSGYKGKYRVLYSLIRSQEQFDSQINEVNLLIHIGEISGSYGQPRSKMGWRVNEDGEIRDTFQVLTHVFEMPEQNFFEYYTNPTSTRSDAYLQSCKDIYNKIYAAIPEEQLPFSNIWAAYKMAVRLPENSVLHLGILNSLRSWNFFEVPQSVLGYANVGGFGIDGDLSSLAGASLADPNRLYFGVLGDLAFFYDMNAIGNHHIGPNIRILMVNNGRGTEFRQYNHPGAAFGDEADKYIAAAGHFGNKSKDLVKHYAEDLGFEYISACDKSELELAYDRFLSPLITDKPLFLEVFTDSTDESNALKMIRNIEKNPTGLAKQVANQILGPKSKEVLKRVLKK